MAVAFLMEFPGTSLAQYDAVIEDLDLINNPQPGGLFHVAGQHDGGVRIVDVWESQGAFDTFLRERLGAALARQGVAPPRVQTWQVHNTLPR